MPTHPSPFLDATDQAALIARGEVSARELAEQAIARVEALDPQLNAVVTTRFERALLEADAIDAQATDQRGPLAGVPFLVKDLEALGGERMTLGCRLFRDFVPRKDDPWIATLRGAGAVALGKTATPEFGLVNTTESALLGRTHSPWDADMSPGGSSGGSAVAMASGMVSLATASDGGGSIRIPACANGIFGLKPSRNRGIMPNHNIPGDLAVTFAYGRSVRDTARLLQISDAARVARGSSKDVPQLGMVQPGAVEPLRVALVLPTIFGTDPEADVERVVREAGALLESLGHHVEEAAYPMDGVIMGEHFTHLWASVPDRLRRSFWALRAYACGWKVWAWPSYEESFEAFTRSMAEMYREQERASPGLVQRALAFQTAAEATWASFFDDYDVVLGPVMRRPSFPLGEIDTSQPLEVLRERLLDNVGYTPVQNFLGLPAMSVPLGTSRGGMPIGVHVTAPLLREERLLRLAYQLEEAAPWAQRRPPVSAPTG